MKDLAVVTAVNLALMAGLLCNPPCQAIGSTSANYMLSQEEVTSIDCSSFPALTRPENGLIGYEYFPSYLPLMDKAERDKLIAAVKEFDPSAPRAFEGSLQYMQDAYSKLADKYEVLLRARPEDVITHYNMAFALQQVAAAIASRSQVEHQAPPAAVLNLQDNAIKEYRQAIAINRQFTAAYNNLGIVLSAEEHFNEAISVFSQGLAIAPDESDLHYNLGITLLNQDMPLEAAHEFDLAQRFKSQSEPTEQDLQQDICRLRSEGHTTNGYALKQARHLDAAIGEFTKAIAFKPNNAHAYYGLAQAYVGSKQYGKALDALQHALALRPDLQTAARNDSTLDNIRNDKRFQALIARPGE